FPSMATTAERRRALTLSLVVVGLLGACATIGSFVLEDLALVFVGGDEYHHISSSLWLFAILGTILSMLQLVVYAVLARQGRRSVYFVWAAFVALVVTGPFVHTARALVSLVVTVDLGLFVLLLGLTAYRLRRDEPAAG
ncbi:MAG TPA: polysaccharide biosynthesis protein, partial [Marmoricola sp.]|nr:polysaccharide biosynthesis protein [Marmoricola sp.]